MAARRPSSRKLAARITELIAARAEVDRERQAQAHTLAVAQEAERNAAEGLALAQRALGRLVDQQDMLSRLRDEGAGLGAGARAVDRRDAGSALAPAGGTRSRRRAAAEVAPLRGVIGTLGELIEVPAELERAVEAAMGGRVQDIVVEGWQDAEAASTSSSATRPAAPPFCRSTACGPAVPSTCPAWPASWGWPASWSNSTRRSGRRSSWR